MSLLVLSAHDVNALTSRLDPNELVSLMTHAFSSFSSGASSSPPRNTISTKEYSALFMPSYAPAYGTAIKVVSVPSPNSGDTSRHRDKKRRDGLPATTLVLDDDTGATKAIVNSRSLTALRNAAGSLLSTRLIGPSNPSNLVLFGAGSQILSHLLLFPRAYPSLKKATIINRTISSNPHIQTLKTHKPNIATEFVQLSDTRNVSIAVRNADIIVTATPSLVSLFRTKDVKSGAHVVLIGSYKPTMREVEDDLLTDRAKGVILVDSREACKEEAGELISSSIPSSSWFEIGEMVAPASNNAEGFELTGKGKEAREEFRQVVESGGITVFKSVGVGVQDTVMASAVVHAAQKAGLGTTIEDYDV